jgi:hypothetical protein
MLFMKPASELRTAYIYAKHGRQADIVDYIRTHLYQAMFAMPAAEALNSG